jgi:protein O-mannosyl-transferase
MNKKHIFAIALFIFSILIAYSNSLNGTWALDDIVANKPVSINDIHDFTGFRKVAYFTFLLNQTIGPFSPVNFRLFNIFIHILNTVLVYVLTYYTITLISKNKAGHTKVNKHKSKPDLIGQNQAFFAALLSGVVFGLHPININAVAYIVQRMTSLATFFILLTILLYIIATQSDNRVKKTLLYILSGISIVLGIFSKENAVMAVPLIILYDYVFLSQKGKKSSHPPFIKEGIKRVIIIVSIGIASIAVASYFLKLHTAFIDIAKFFLNPNQPLTAREWMAIDVYWTPLQHIFTEFRVVARYLVLILLPLPQLLVFDWWGFPVSQGITEPITTLLSFLLIILLTLLAVWKLRRYPMLCFGILWYLIAVSLESFLAPGSDLYFEHRNYLPVSGLFAGIAGQFAASCRIKMQEKTLWAVAFVLCILLGFLTFSRNYVWKDSISLWSDTLNKAPSNIRAMTGLANAHLKLSDFNNAEKYFTQAVQLSSSQNRFNFLNDSAYSLGMIYLFQGKTDQARKLIDGFGEKFESYRIKILRGYYKSLKNDLDGAIEEYNNIINKTRGRDKVIVLTLLGDAYRKKGLWDNAIEYYSQAIATDPGFSAAYYGMGVSFINKKEVERAYEYLQKALSIEPDNVLALSDMADLMLIMKSKPENALIYAQRAVSKSPPFYQPYLTMGNVLIVLGREAEADNHYKKAIDRGMPDYMLLFGKARAYYIKGDKEKTEYYLSELEKNKNLPERLRKLIIGR